MRATVPSELAMSELPTGTVTLLLADVEGSTRLWETQPDVMTDAVARLDAALTDAVATHGGVRPVEQGEGDSFVVAFARAVDAVTCALDLQRAPFAPIKLRIGLHTGDVQLRDEGNYIGPTINRAARLRDLAHGGQTVLSGSTEPLVVDQLPPDVTLVDLGTHPMRDLPRPERVVQLCHPEIPADFPPLRTAAGPAAHNVPTQLTTFVGRRREVRELREALTDNRLVTLTGVGGTGKTRLAVELANELVGDFADGVWFVDLAPIAVADLVPTTVARALKLPDQPGRPTMDSVQRFVRDKRMLLVLDNCEHLLDASASIVTELLSASERLALLTTSREQLGVAGEVSWRVPSLSLADEAIELFADRARRARPDFRLTAENSSHVAEICTRLDGLPLAIELAATRVRALSLTEIIGSLHDRFRLLTGGSRTAVRRQQTLRASVDWSHALLTETERTLFRRLAVFVSGFDIDAAHRVSGDAERYQVLDQLTLLVDKSLVLAEDGPEGTRYRLPETVRQYALEKLGESGEGDEIRSRHRDHFASMAALLDVPAREGYERRIQQADSEIDNLRTAFGWNLERGDIDGALRLASNLQPLWGAIGRVREGRAWFSTVLSDDGPDVDVRPEVLARALADKSFLDTWEGAASGFVDASRALAIAREVGDPALLLRALTVFSSAIGYSDDSAAVRPYFAEAADLARHLGDDWHLCEILARQGYAAIVAGDPTAIRAAAEEGRDIADAIGDHFDSRECRLGLAWAQLMEGDVSGAVSQFRDVLAESDAAGALFLKPASSQGLGNALAYGGQIDEALSVSRLSIDATAELGEFFQGIGYSAMATAAMAAGDISTARDACEIAWQHMSNQSHLAAAQRATNAGIVCAAGDLTTARRWLAEAMDSTAGWNRARAHLVTARIALADDDLDAALSNAHECLRLVAEFGTFVTLPDVFEYLAVLAVASDGHAHAARLCGAAESFRRATGAVRFKVYDAEYEAAVAALREAMPPEDFDRAWAEGAAMSTEEAIAYAQRGRGERKRPSTGWASLTPTEHDVVRLVVEGLTNKDVAARLFISPRTVQAHLAHVFAKLGVTTRTQLAQEAARHVRL